MHFVPVVVLLRSSHPQTVEVAVFIDCHNGVATGADFGARFVGKGYKAAAVLCSHIDECDVMLREHGVWSATHFNAEGTVVDAGEHREVLFA